ncbi:Similar to Ndufaf6: NADH dehydrogenase (ubiquinone) complex I [Cotesia congregata]|uniref:Assembly factor 6 (Rattus norvegicus) n=1 Tax=Cotesia congregata TaxID=51543 RepID=A0A8J2HF94_COTCN|nr:Similar to Ndufaf6: NADH dehydrogenase (ubiquinone) complex I [Cotesia congregata]
MNKTRFLTKINFNNSSRFVSTVKKQSPTQYCLQLVRYCQAPAIAIRAFNVEIALVQEHSRELAIANMRYTFWNDTLAKIFDNTPPEAPVPLELSRILKTRKLSKRYFQRLLDARWKHSQGSSFLDLAAMEQYSENTLSSIYYLLLEVKDIKDVNVDHMASHLGKAQGIINLLRSVPYHAQRRNLVLPQDVLMQNNAKKLRKNIKMNLDYIFLPAVIVERYLKKLQYVDFNIFDKRLHIKENMLPFKLLWEKLFTKW